MPTARDPERQSSLILSRSDQGPVLSNRMIDTAAPLTSSRSPFFSLSDLNKLISHGIGRMMSRISVTMFWAEEQRPFPDTCGFAPLHVALQSTLAELAIYPKV